MKKIFFLFLLFFCTIQLASAQNVTIGDYSIGIGEEAIVPVTVLDAENVAGGVVKITFDPAVVSAEEVIAGDFSAFMPLINNSDGWVKLVATSATAANKNEAVLGNVKFKGISTGATEIRVEYASLNDAAGSLITPAVFNGSITITGTIPDDVIENPYIHLKSLSSYKTVDNINASYSIEIFNGQNKEDTFDLIILNHNTSSVAALNQSSITIQPWESKEVTLNATDETAGDYFVTVKARSQSNVNITGEVTTKTIVRDSFSINLASLDGTVTSIGADITYLLTIQNNQNNLDTLTLSPSGIDTSWISFDTIHQLSAGEQKTIPIKITVPDASNAGVFALTVSAESSNVGTVRDSSLPLTVQNGPVISDLVPENNIYLGSDDVIFSWITNTNSTTELILNQNGVDTVYTGDNGIYHSVIVENLTRNQGYTFRVISNTTYGSTQSDERSFYIDNGVSFTQKIYDFNIEREYDQRVAVTVKNTDSIPHAILLTVNSTDPELIVGFVGEGSTDEIIALAPDESKDITLALHAQDTFHEDYYLLFNLITDSNITDNAIANINVRQPDIDLRFEELSTDPQTLTKTIRITNHGDSVTDLNIYGSGELNGNVTFDPIVTHGYLGGGSSITFEAVPLLSLDFTGMRGDIVAEAAGVNTSYPVNFTLPDGMEVYLGYIGAKKPSYYHTVPEYMMVLAEQISKDTVIISINSVYNNSESIFLINSTTRIDNKFIIKVDSLEAEGGTKNTTVKNAYKTYINIPEGNYSVEIIENKLNITLANKNFTMHKTGVLIDDGDLILSLGTFKGGVDNDTLYVVPSISNPVIAPELFEYTNFWANSTDQLYLGIKLTNNGSTKTDVNLNISSPFEKINVAPAHNSIGTSYHDSQSIGFINLTIDNVTFGVYNITYILSYSDDAGSHNINGNIPIGIYEKHITLNKSENSTTTRLISPFNDSIIYTQEGWHNYSVGKGFIWKPSNVSFEAQYSNFTLQEPHSPWAHVIAGGVIGGVITGGYTLVDEVNSGDGIDYTRVAINAGEGAVGGALITGTFGVAGTASVPMMAKGALMSIGISELITGTSQLIAGEEINYLAGINIDSISSATLSAGLAGAPTLGSAYLKTLEHVNKYPTGKYAQLWENPLTRDAAIFKYVQTYTVKSKVLIPVIKPIAEFVDNYILTAHDVINSNVGEGYLNIFYSVGDQISDVIYQGMFNSLKSLEDIDGDGVATLEEIMMGSNPLNPNDVPGILKRIIFSNWYCTNRPNIESQFILPTTIQLSLSPTYNIEEGYLVMRFFPSNHQARPHNIYIFLNDVEIGNLTNTIPSGHYVFSFDPEILNYAEKGVATNTVTLKTQHFNGGHYAITTDMKVILPMNRVEMYVIANSQDEANQIVNDMTGAMRNKVDLGIYPENIMFSSLVPIGGENITINTTIFNLGTAGASHIAIQLLDNGVQRGENETIVFISSMDSIPVNLTWTPTSGTHNITIRVNSEGRIQESDYSNNEASKTITVGITPDTTPPMSVTDMYLQTAGDTWLNWIWTKPPDSDFAHTEIYLNGIFQTNISAEYFNATGLEPETNYTIGTHTVDNYGNVNETWVNLTATTRNAPIIVEAGPDQTVKKGTTVNFEGNFTASGLHTYSFHWDFGDGTNTTGFLTPSHVYEDAGVYEVTLTVTDYTGDMGNDILNVTVNNASVSVFPGYANPPTDLDQDGLYEDINGNGRLDFDDLVAYFANMDWIEENMPLEFLDYNKNGLIDFDDVVTLFDIL